ncbi:hypothetical protein SLS59_003214 [Nothophoma quercina]|uniref:Uncharacterized protein n=1 Tax=Nothophoma quercina TaxID=749835 RepID=A0ABR3RPM9_9PLEO
MANLITNENGPEAEAFDDHSAESEHDDEEEKEAEGAHQEPFVKPMSDMSSWIQGIQPSEADYDNLAEQDSDFSDVQLPDYEAFVCRSDAYTWLLTSIRQHRELSWGTWERAQVTTVTEYLEQTWPTTGKTVLQLLHKILSEPKGDGKLDTLTL